MIRNLTLLPWQLKESYQAVAKKKNIHMIAASDYAIVSEVDQEHLDEKGHALFAEAVCRALFEYHIL